MQLKKYGKIVELYYFTCNQINCLYIGLYVIACWSIQNKKVIYKLKKRNNFI